MGKKIFFFIFLVINTLLASAQNYNFRYYGVEDGLSSTEIYTVIQDDEGYLWFGTSRGASRFDGYEFRNFTASDGLPANSVIKLFKDKWGRIWFATYDGSLSYFQKGKIIPFKYNDTLLIIDKQYYIYNLFFDKDSTLWIMPSRGGIYKFFPNGKIEKYEIPHKDSLRSFYFKDTCNNFIFTYLRGKKSDSLFVKNNKNGFKIYGFKTYFRHNFLKLDKNKYLISLGNELILIAKDKIIFHKKYENDITGITKDNQGNIWISVMFDGVYKYGKDLNLLGKYLEKKSPVKVFQDNEGGYWFATIESGLFYTASFQFTPYQFQYNIQAIEVGNNKLYLSTFDKHIFEFELYEDKILSIRNIPFENRTSSIMDILYTKNHSLYLIGKGLFKLSDEMIKSVDKFSGGFKIFEDKDNKLLVTSKGGFRIYQNDKLLKNIHIENYLISNAIIKDQKNTIWLGSVTGLYSFRNNQKKYWGTEDSLLKSRINDIKLYGNYLLLATNGNGLLIFNPNTKKIKQLTENEGISSNFINAIFIDKQDIWLGTNKGLTKLTINFDDEEIKFFIEKFNKSDGLHSEEIKDILKYKQFFFLGTSKGLISFNPEKLKKNTLPPILHITRFLVNGNEIKNYDNLKLKHNQNNISIHYKGISFRAEGNIIYQYRLTGFDDKWHITKERIIRYPNLPSGNYTFELKASIDGINWNETPIQINFKIKKPFYKTIFFPLLIISIIAGIIYLILWLNYRNMARELEHRKRLILAEQKALRSQMNPHFIFNSLNSIRRYILENDVINADYYLTSFATLMRKVLDNSKNDFIPLAEEIETLKLYLELEKMRFNNKFDFKIEIDPQIDIYEILIPPMLIQPLIENAIWHGLAPKKSDGFLLVKFEKLKNEFLKITVQDNGIGRDKASEISAKRKGHKSTGISNIKNRIRYLSILTKSKMVLDFEDLYDEKGNPSGTKVILIINYKAFENI